MSSNAQKTPFTRTLSRFAERKALDEIQKRGQALPGHVVAVNGQIVTVNFDLDNIVLPQVTMPLASSEYARVPIQPGAKGVAMPASVYLGGISGLGGGTADTILRGNLSTLVWLPVATKAWSAPPGGDAHTYTLYGDTALNLLDSIAGHSSIKLTSSSITLTCGGHTIVIDSTGVTIDGKVFLTHKHTGVTTGGGVTGNVQ